MQEVMVGWRDRGRGGTALDGGGISNAADGDVSLPLGPGEWEEPLGLPLCVVCQNVQDLHLADPGADTDICIVRSNRESRKGSIMERRRV